MDSTKMLLNAYYEALYKRIKSNRELLEKRIAGLVREEIERLGLDNLSSDKINAYREASIAFLDERLESYDPVGYQYIYKSGERKRASKVQNQLDWFDSRQEFASLVDSAGRKMQSDFADERLEELALRLIDEFGAFPDKSIISAYEPEPALPKLPDYVLSRAIEEVLK